MAIPARQLRASSVLVSVLLLVVLVLPDPPQALSPRASSSPATTPRAELGCLTLDKSCGSEKEFMVIKTEVFVLG
jgi:hypothetical protein